MACYYYIKLPNGGEVKVPATLIKLSESDKYLKELLSSFDNTAEDSELLDYLKSLNTGLDTPKLKNILNNTSPSELITTINSAIENNYDPNDISKSIWKLMTGGVINLDYKSPNSTKYSKISIDTFLTHLNTEIGENYFHSISDNGIVNITPPSTQLTEIYKSVVDLRDVGMRSDIEDSLVNVLKTFYGTNTLKNKNLFFNTSFNGDINDAIVIETTNTKDPIIFYNKGNNLSLFMGIFKQLASKIDIVSLTKVINAYNKNHIGKNEISLKDLDVKKFFLGEFVNKVVKIENEDNGEPILSENKSIFIDGDFKKLFKFSNTEEVINLLVEEIIKPQGSHNYLRNSFQTLLKHFDKEKYGKNIYLEEDQLKEFYNKETKQNIETVALIKGSELLPFINKNTRDYFYSETKNSEELNDNDSIYNYIKNNVVFNRDLLKITMPENKIDRFIVPVNIFIGERGVLVKGFYEDKGGIKIQGSVIIPIGSKVSYKTLVTKEMSIVNEVNANPINKNESIIIIGEEGKTLPPELVQKATIRGSTVFVSRIGKTDQSNIIKNVYANKIIANTVITPTKTFSPIINLNKVSKIITNRDIFEDTFTDATWENKVNTLNNFEQVNARTNSFLPIKSGDYIKYQLDNISRYNKVIAASENEIFILIKSGEKYFSKAIPRKSIDSVWKQRENLTYSELQDIAYFADRVIKDKSVSGSNYSYFTNFEMSKDGDFAIINNEIYKIENKEQKLLVKLKLSNNTMVMTNEYSRNDNINNETQFITTRDISSEIALDTADKNNRYLKTSGDAENHVEMVYLIPKNLDINTSILLNSGNLNIGQTGTKEYFYTEDVNGKNKIPKDYIDVTDKLIAQINNKRGTTGTALVVQEKNKYYTRYDASLYKSKFSENSEEKRTLLTPNTYIVLSKTDIGAKKSQNRTYRIIADSNNILTLEYNTFSHTGKLITVIKNISKDSNDIMWIAVMKGGEKETALKNMDSVITNDNSKENSTEELSNNKKILQSNIMETFQRIFNIPIEERDDHTLGNKKAWIESTVGQVPKLILNTNNINTSGDDLIHEYLHLFLMALKYDRIKGNDYEKLMQSYRNSSENPDISNEKNLSVVEEYFVKDVTNFLQGKIDTLVDYGTFKNGINSALESLKLEPLVLDSENILSILNLNMGKIFNRQIGPMKAGLVLFESNFRDWMTSQINDQQIIVECQ